METNVLYVCFICDQNISRNFLASVKDGSLEPYLKKEEEVKKSESSQEDVKKEEVKKSERSQEEVKKEEVKDEL